MNIATRAPRLLLSASIIAVLLGNATPVSASSPDAWNAHYAEVKAKCLAASRLSKAKAVGYAGFSDDVGDDVVRIDGIGVGSTETIRMVCIFNRSTRKAVAAEMRSFPTKY